MRLWHQDLISRLPRQQLLGQHRECCALRGLAWGRKHSTVQYVFKYNPGRLFAYHRNVMGEMIKRGYTVDPAWFSPFYRGKNCQLWETASLIDYGNLYPVFPEHNDTYFQECLSNLKRKGIIVDRPYIF